MKLLEPAKRGKIPSAKAVARQWNHQAHRFSSNSCKSFDTVDFLFNGIRHGLERIKQQHGNLYKALVQIPILPSRAPPAGNGSIKDLRTKCGPTVSFVGPNIHPHQDRDMIFNESAMWCRNKDACETLNLFERMNGAEHCSTIEAVMTPSCMACGGWQGIPWQMLSRPRRTIPSCDRDLPNDLSKVVAPLDRRALRSAAHIQFSLHESRIAD